MCAILDANAAHEVFGDRTELGAKFWRWLDEGHGRLVLGGKLRSELADVIPRKWLRQAILDGQVHQESDNVVDKLSGELERDCRSDDPHIIALTRVSGARLLYSNDRALQKDFKNRTLINRPGGKIVGTSKSSKLTEDYVKLLARKDLRGRRG